MLRVIILSAPVLLLFSYINAQNFSGNYSAYNPSNGIKVLISFNQESMDLVTGKLILNGTDIYKIQGKVEKDYGDYILKGSILKDNDRSFFEALLENNQLYFTWVPANQNNQPDYNSAIDVVLTKEGQSNGNNNMNNEYSINQDNTNSSGDDNYYRDPALVGLWSYSESYTSGDFSMATEKYMEVRYDGTYSYGNGRVIGGGDSGTFDSGTDGNDVLTGRWRTENSIIYIDEGYGNWVPYASYYVEGDKLLIKFNNGEKELWYRQ